jgi:hypothetical protein
MSNVIPFRPRPVQSFGTPIIYKVVNGETIECIDVDALTAIEREKFFNGKRNGAPEHEAIGAPDA